MYFLASQNFYECVGSAHLLLDRHDEFGQWSVARTFAWMRKGKKSQRARAVGGGRNGPLSVDTTHVRPSPKTRFPSPRVTSALSSTGSIGRIPVLLCLAFFSSHAHAALCPSETDACLKTRNGASLSLTV